MAQTFDWANKDPNEEKKYWHDWTDYLGEGESITSVECLVEHGSVTFENGDAVDGGNLQMVKLLGGQDGENCSLTLRANIDSGDQSYDVGIRIKIRQK